MALSLRLKTIAKYTEGFNSLADIACDHGYLGIYAAKTYGIKDVLLTDINPMPLASAQKNSLNANLENVIRCKLGNGLAPIDRDYEVISISGIGGLLLKEILINDLEKAKKAKRLILCPNTDLYEVRNFLHENNFKIETEEIILEHKYYEIIVASYNGKKEEYTLLELKYGPFLLKQKSDIFIKYYTEQLKLYEKQIDFVTDEAARVKLSKKIAEINKILTLQM